MQVYPPNYYAQFSPTTEFTKWATVEVSSYDNLPEGLQTFDLPGGLYAVFDYKGSSADPSIFQYIFSEWLPKSDYVVDDRPHFEVLGHKYKNNDPNSEEEIWVPVRRSSNPLKFKAPFPGQGKVSECNDDGKGGTKHGLMATRPDFASKSHPTLTRVGSS